MDNAGRRLNFAFLPQDAASSLPPGFLESLQAAASHAFASQPEPAPPGGAEQRGHMNEAGRVFSTARSEQGSGGVQRISISFQAVPFFPSPAQNREQVPAPATPASSAVPPSTRPTPRQNSSTEVVNDPAALLSRLQSQVASEISRAFGSRPRMATPPPTPPPFVQDLLAGLGRAQAQGGSPQMFPMGAFPRPPGNLQEFIAAAANAAATAATSSTSGPTSANGPRRRSFTTTTNSGGHTTFHTVVQMNVDGANMGMDQAAMQDMLGGSGVIQDMIQQLLQMMPGSRQPPANSAQLDRFLETQACVFEDREPGSEADPCPICLDDMTSGQEGITMPCCRKSFHRSCAVRWLSKESNTCPVCRRSLPEHPPKPEATIPATSSASVASSNHAGENRGGDFCEAVAEGAEALSAMSVAELRGRCKRRGLDCSNCLEKQDMVALLLQGDRSPNLDPNGSARCHTPLHANARSHEEASSSRTTSATSGSITQPAPDIPVAELRDTECFSQAISASSSVHGLTHFPTTSVSSQSLPLPTDAPVSSSSKAVSPAASAKRKSGGRGRSAPKPLKRTLKGHGAGALGSPPQGVKAKAKAKAKAAKCVPLSKRACKRSIAAPVRQLQIQKRSSAAETAALATGAGKRRRSC